MTTEYAQHLGSRIREARTKANFTLRQFAKRAEISPSYLSSIELGENEPTVSKMQRIAKELKIPLSKLLPDQE